MSIRRLAGLLLLVATALALPAGLRGQGDAVRFGVIGDYGLAGPDAAAVAALVISWAPDFIATTGDNNYFGGAASTIDANIGQYYHAYIFPYHGSYGPGATVNRFWPALGNHDWDTAGAGPYRAYFALPGNERYYSIVRGPVHLFVVDSDWREPDGVKVDSKQAAWLRAGLAASTAPWKIVALHHAPYSSGDHGSGTWMQWPFAQWGAHAVLSGHDHSYERVTDSPFPYFVNGLGGAPRHPTLTPIPGSQVRFSDAHGAMRVDADPEKIRFRFFTVSGELVDAYTLYTDPGAHRPGAPSGLTAVPISGTEVDLAWVDNASNESEVLVEAAAGAGPFTALAVLAAESTHLELVGLEPLTAYRFRIVARNGAGDSAASDVAAATTTQAGPPPAPDGLTATPVSFSRIDLSWTDSAVNERGVVLERSADGGPFAVVASLPANTTGYAVTGLAAAPLHAFRVRAHNASGSSPYSDEARARTLAPDLVVAALAGVPASIRPGQAASITSTVANQGTATAKSSTARQSLVDGQGRRTVLGGGSAVSALAPGQQGSVKTSVTVPASMPPGTYRWEGCADATAVIAESFENNNCTAWGTPVKVGWPDLRALSVTGPARVRRGITFGVSDTVRNDGVAGSGTSRTRYYLEADGQPTTRLNGQRSVAALAPGQQSTGSASVSVPTAVALGTYRLRACADGDVIVREADETNNCVLASGSIVVDP